LHGQTGVKLVKLRKKRHGGKEKGIQVSQTQWRRNRKGTK
jgi:hypothetical protein